MQAGTAVGVPDPHPVAPWSSLRGRQTEVRGLQPGSSNVHGKEHSSHEGPRPLACVTFPQPSEADGATLLFQMGKPRHREVKLPARLTQLSRGLAVTWASLPPAHSPDACRRLPSPSAPPHPPQRLFLWQFPPGLQEGWGCAGTGPLVSWCGSGQARVESCLGVLVSRRAKGAPTPRLASHP